MLTLSRKKGEELFIDGGRIVVTVVDIRGDKVRLGITAPPDVPILRKEVFAAIKRDGGHLPPPETSFLRKFRRDSVGELPKGGEK